jgi:hypothetical protein
LLHRFDESAIVIPEASLLPRRSMACEVLTKSRVFPRSKSLFYFTAPAISSVCLPGSLALVWIASIGCMPSEKRFPAARDSLPRVAIGSPWRFAQVLDR